MAESQASSNAYGLSEQDLTDLRQIRSFMKPGDPRAAKIDTLLGTTKQTGHEQKLLPQEGLAPKIGRGAAIGAFEGLGVATGSTPAEVINGTFKNLSQGARELLISTWKANEFHNKFLKANDTPISRGVRTALDLIPTFIIDTANQLEQNESEFKQAIQRKDWEAASEIAAKSVTTLAMLKHGKEAPESAAETAAKPRSGLSEMMRSQLRRTTGAKYGASEAVAKGIEKGQHHALAIDVDKGSVELGKDIDELEGRVHKEANRRFDAIRQKVGNAQGDPSALIGTVKGVQENVLQGIPENIKEFRSILGMEGQAEGPLSIGGAEISPGEAGYETVKQAYIDEGLFKPNEPLTWDKLQSLKSRIDARLRKATRMNGDLKRALFQVRDSVVDEMGKMAVAGGAAEDWASARDFYRQWKEDFHEPTGPSGSGSPVAQAHDAVDPSKIRQPFLRTRSTIGNRGTDILRKYPQFGGDRIAEKADSLIAKQDQMAELPKSKGKPTVDIRKAARERILQLSQRIGRLNVWDARIIATSLIVAPISLMIGHPAGLFAMAGPAYVALKEVLSRQLERESVIKWLAEPTKAEIDSLNQLPGIDKINVADGLTAAAEDIFERNHKKLKMSSDVRRLLGPHNVARLVRLGAVNAQRTSKKPGEQLRDLNRMTSSNPAFPVGESE